MSMAKKVKQKEPAKPPPKTKYEDTKEFKTIDRLMRGNRGVVV